MAEKPPDCPTPEHVICPLAGTNGWPEYKRLVMTNQEQLARQIADLRRENKAEHAEIFALMRQRDHNVDRRITGVETGMATLKGEHKGGNQWLQTAIAVIAGLSAVAAAVGSIALR